MKSRAEYLEANNLSRTQPWLTEGISRRTWERRRKRDASLAAIHKSNALDRPAASLRSPTSSKAWVSENGISLPNCLLHRTRVPSSFQSVFLGHPTLSLMGVWSP